MLIEFFGRQIEVDEKKIDVAQLASYGAIIDYTTLGQEYWSEETIPEGTICTLDAEEYEKWYEKEQQLIKALDEYVPYRKPIQPIIENRLVVPKRKVVDSVTGKVKYRPANYTEVIPEMKRQCQTNKEQTRVYNLASPAKVKLQLNKNGLLCFWDEQSRTYVAVAMTRYAEGVLCAKLGLNRGIYKELLNSHYDCERSTGFHLINKLLSEYPYPMSLRVFKGHVIGITSIKYTAFEADKLLDALDKAIIESKYFKQSDFVIRGYYNSPEFFQLRFTTKEPQGKLNDKDLYYGLAITNSDVGKRRLSITFYVYKQICSNGLCISVFNKKLFCQRHIGLTQKEFQQGVVASLKAFPALMEKCTELINQMENIDMIDSPLTNFWQNSLRAENIRRRMKLYLNIGEDGLRDIAEIVHTKYSATAWGYINAITEYAQSFDVERRHELEVLAGRLMEKPRLLLA